MTDKTTAGVSAEPEEVEALLHNLCGFHLAERDPVERYTVLTREQVLYEALAAAIRRERGRALAELVERGHKLAEVAALTGLRSRQQVQRLIQVGAAGGAESGAQAVVEAQEASRQFEERLAAVEATLDEVVSGVPTINEPATSVTDDYDSVMAKEPFVLETFGGRARETSVETTERFTADPYPTLDSGAYPAVDVPDPAPQPRVAAVEGDFDPLTGDINQLAGMLEPTQVMPALAASLQPTRELSVDDTWIFAEETDAR